MSSSLSLAQWTRAVHVATGYLHHLNRGHEPIALSTEDLRLLSECVRTIAPTLGIPLSTDPHDAEVEGDALVGTITRDEERAQDARAEGRALPYLPRVLPVSRADVDHVLATDPIYGGSWQKRGGVGAFMMLARKWDRLEERVKARGWDVFRAIVEDTHRDGVIDDIRDLRRYLLLVEAKHLTDRGEARG